MICVKCFSGPFIDGTPVIRAEDNKYYCPKCIPDTEHNRELLKILDIAMNPVKEQ